MMGGEQLMERVVQVERVEDWRRNNVSTAGEGKD